MIAWTLCDDWGISTWQVSLPRARVRHTDGDGPVPSGLAVGVEVRSRDGSYTLAWDTSHVFRFDMNVFLVEDPAWSQGNLSFVLEQTDPILTFMDARARFDVGFRILHPVP